MFRNHIVNVGMILTDLMQHIAPHQYSHVSIYNLLKSCVSVVMDSILRPHCTGVKMSLSDVVNKVCVWREKQVSL